MSQWDDPQNRETQAYPRQNPQVSYGQPNYPQANGQPNYQVARQPRFADSTANPFGAASDQQFGIVSTVLALLGGILGIVTLTGLEWFHLKFGGSASFGDVHDALKANPSSATGFASAYFGWLAWTFLIVAVLAGVMASFPSPALRAFRVIGVVVGFAAAGLSFLAIQLQQGSYFDYLKEARIGFYLMVVAYLLAGIGAAIGPRKV
jgi:hypothetical protein